MSLPSEPSHRLALADILAEPVTPEAFFQTVRARIIRTQQQERRAPQETAALIRERLPDLAARTLADADLALAGMLVLPGTMARPYFVGNPPDWFANPVNDNEYRWLLNRMGHWRPLLSAYSLTGDRRYAEKVVQELKDWIEWCPWPPLEYDPERARAVYRTTTPWRSLETGIRMFESWPLVLEHLADSDVLTPDLVSAYAISLYEHAERLAEETPVLFPKADHNMHVMQNLGLLSVANLFPEFVTAERWRSHAMAELERAARLQLTDEGGQVEGCPHYENVTVHYFSRAQQIARMGGVSFSDTGHVRVRRGLDYSVYAFRPSSTGVPWGDSDADLRAVTAALHFGLGFEDWRPLSRLAALAGREAALGECLKNIWRIPDPAAWLGSFDALCDASDVPLPTVSWQRTLGQVAMRTDWTQDALSVFFACHTATSSSGHAHIDPMGFDFTALGRPLIVDPGRYTYRSDDDRRTFKTAAYHNSLMIDGADPYPFLASGRSGRPKHQEIVWVQQSDGLLAAEAVHHNYEPATHRRVVALVDGAILLVLDHLRDLGPERQVQVFYHFDSEDVTWDAERQAATSRHGDVSVVLQTTASMGAQLLDGRVSDFLDVARPSRRLCLEEVSAPEGSERVYASVIVPYRTADPVPAVSALAIERDEADIRCRFEVRGRVYAFAWTHASLERTSI